MRVIELCQAPALYSCRSYLLLGEWNRIADVNTLIDPGTDGWVIAEIERLATGFGKLKVAQIILTHNHFDHAGGIGVVKKHFGAQVHAWCEGKEVDALLTDGQLLAAGDGQLQVVHSPGHSSDSVALYCEAQRLLFSGDTQLRVRTPGGTFSPEYVETLRRLARLEIATVYSGHDPPLTGEVRETILLTLANVLNRKVT